mgnify:CR=1 FL=1
MLWGTHIGNILDQLGGDSLNGNPFRDFQNDQELHSEHWAESDMDGNLHKLLHGVNEDDSAELDEMGIRPWRDKGGFITPAYQQLVDTVLRLREDDRTMPHDLRNRILHNAISLQQGEDNWHHHNGIGQRPAAARNIFNRRRGEFEDAIYPTDDQFDERMAFNALVSDYHQTNIRSNDYNEEDEEDQSAAPHGRRWPISSVNNEQNDELREKFENYTEHSENTFDSTLIDDMGHGGYESNNEEQLRPSISEMSEQIQKYYDKFEDLYTDENRWSGYNDNTGDEDSGLVYEWGDFRDKMFEYIENMMPAEIGSGTRSANYLEEAYDEFKDHLDEAREEAEAQWQDEYGYREGEGEEYYQGVHTNYHVETGSDISGMQYYMRNNPEQANADLERAGLTKDDISGLRHYIVWNDDTDSYDIVEKGKEKYGEDFDTDHPEYDNFANMVTALDAMRTWKEDVLPNFSPGDVLNNSPVGGPYGQRAYLYYKNGFGKVGQYGQNAIIGRDGKVYPVDPPSEEDLSRMREQRRHAIVARREAIQARRKAAEDREREEQEAQAAEQERLNALHGTQLELDYNTETPTPERRKRS